jgi:glycosyltransferase involved in cell wall biosynthesis
VTIEAAARGRASLLTAVPGSVDLIPSWRKLKNGIKFGDVKALADALEEWFSHPEEVVREGEKFFAFLKASSDPGTIARAYTEIYRSILHERSVRAISTQDEAVVPDRVFSGRAEPRPDRGPNSF